MELSKNDWKLFERGFPAGRNAIWISSPVNMQNFDQ